MQGAWQSSSSSSIKENNVIHRYRVGLFDDNELDAEIIEKIHSSRRRQEYIRSLIRAGHALLVRKLNDSQSMMLAMDNEEMEALIMKDMASRANGPQEDSSKNPAIHSGSMQPPSLTSEDSIGESHQEDMSANIANDYFVHTGEEHQDGISENSNEDIPDDEPEDFMEFLRGQV